MLKWSLLALAALHGAAGAATAAAISASLPPPGLYRVDMDTTSAYRDGTRVARKLDATTW